MTVLKDIYVYVCVQISRYIKSGQKKREESKEENEEGSTRARDQSLWKRTSERFLMEDGQMSFKNKDF